ncbi:MAG TPA: hypothetical protein PKN33_19705 [Phycisphaerae bacterium]|nr:hypothetical protein [Phycisphaerae bacterium]
MNKAMEEYAQLIGKCLARRWMRDHTACAEEQEVNTGLDRATSNKQIDSQETTEGSSR